MQANLLAATTLQPESGNQIYNVAVGDRTELVGLFEAIRDLLAECHPEMKNAMPIFRDFRAGDVRHSLADVGKAQRLLGYQPTHRIKDGLRDAMAWYLNAGLLRE